MSKATSQKKISSHKPKASSQRLLKVAIFDMTDCEGCELEFINLREKLTKFADQVEIANWRLACDNHNPGPFDLTFIEGTPITEGDIEAVKQARAVSKTLVSLGSCADLGGVQSMIGKVGWNKGLKLVYGKNYQSNSKAPKPLSYYVDIDVHLPGCPISGAELERYLGAFLVGKKPEEARFPVCLECKAQENNCLLLEGKPCLGPVTKGGCDATCPSRGLRCWGCYGALRGGNQKALKKHLEKNFGKDRTEQLFEAFMSQQDEFKEMYPKEK